jgi:1-deoxy-D-xylulose-5-phosphate reductoisomerase
VARRRIVILGSTGSIGCQALEVLAETPSLEVVGLAAGRNGRKLIEQARAAGAQTVALSDGDSAADLAETCGEITLLTGPDAMEQLVRQLRPDVVLTAVVGSAGLGPTLAAIEVGADLALANKETLVCAGALVMQAAERAGVTIFPVDSEHAGLAQCLAAGRAEEVRRAIITSSGGALRDWPDEKAATAGVDDALAHPTWQMGPKITVDSATLMNKTLEIIEAHWLFDLQAEQIEVVIHPQSIIHAMVEFCDGSMVAQLAEPDMKGPIAQALHWPRRPARPVPPLDLAVLGELTFQPVTGRFAEAVELAWEVIGRGGCAGAVVNGANEAAVEAFLAGRIAFGQIVPLVRNALDAWDQQKTGDEKSDSIPLQAVLDADAWARTHVSERVDTAGRTTGNETNHG